jgi:hypothetical protein
LQSFCTSNFTAVAPKQLLGFTALSLAKSPQTYSGGGFKNTPYDRHI